MPSLRAVSIQLLFLFNFSGSGVTSALVKFQYSFCSYSTWEAQRHIVHGYMFQYSFCSYSTDFHEEVISFVGRFQYSFCSYSTIFKRRSNRMDKVSIQLLFLFNDNNSVGSSQAAAVSIQFLFLFN